MKKNIALLLSIITLFSCIYYIRINKEKDHILRGEKQNEFLYAYNLNEDGKEWNGYNLKNKDIYYLLSKEEKDGIEYELYRRNIYEEKNILIKDFKKENTYCNLINDNIFCSNNDEIFLYDYSLREKYSTKTNESEDFPKIVPYKDTYLKYLNNTLYLKQDTKEKEFRKIPEEIEEVIVEEYYVEKNNTYLLLFDLNNDTYYIYDINKNTYEKITSKNSYKYDKGFYFYDKDKFQIINIKDNKKEEYQNISGEDYHYTSLLDKETIYFYNIIEDRLEILNLKNNILKSVELEITKDNPINSIKKRDNYLLIELLQDQNNFYIIDLDKLEAEEINIEEEKKKEEEKLLTTIEEIKENKNVNILIKEDTNIKFPDFSAEIETDNNLINETLIKIEKILDKYNKEFFDSFYLNKYEGLNIYLTSKLKPSNLETQISNPAAYSLIKDRKYTIVIDINQPNIEELLCHELLHNTEFALSNQNLNPFTEWDSLNPEEFIYNNSYTSPYIFNYTLTEDSSDKVYFVDSYSHTYPTEDRARIFENICSCDSDSLVKKYPNLIKKANYIEEELYKYYPTLKETNLFQSIKGLLNN